MSFEDRLLHELRNVVVANQTSGGGRKTSWSVSRSPRRLALVGAAAVFVSVAAVAVVQLVGGGAAPAYAVNKNDDGTVTVEISSLSDAAGLERKLRDAGIPAVVQYLPPGKACKQPWPTAAPGAPASASDDSAVTADAEKAAIKGGVEHTPDRTRFTISKNLPADTTLVIMTQVNGPSEATGPSSIGITLAHGEVQPCQIVDAPAGSPPFGPPPAGAHVHTENGAAQGLSSSAAQ
jgi:hypothetical protein